MYTRSLHGETIYEWPMDLVFMSIFNDKSMSIGCVGKLGHLFGLLRHHLLTTPLEVTNYVKFCPT